MATENHVHTDEGLSAFPAIEDTQKVVLNLPRSKWISLLQWQIFLIQNFPDIGTPSYTDTVSFLIQCMDDLHAEDKKNDTRKTDDSNTGD